MKNILVLAILFVCLQLPAQSDTSGIQFIETADSTGFGTPNGKLVSSQIGTAGGKIVSDDGRVELIFSAGSLIGTTAISIQATTNLLDSAAGNAYRFEPSGIQFNIPVQILFRYSDEENEICPAELMQFAMQDHSGKWTYIEYDDWDSTTRTLKGKIHHFSSFTNVYKISLKTEYAIFVNDSATVALFHKGKTIKSGDLEGELAYAQLYAGNKRDWFVNGVGGGTVYDGYLKDDFVYVSGKTLFLNGKFFAPWFLPKKNPVKLSLGIRYYSKKRGLVWGFCSTQIIVYDAYKVKVEHEATGRDWMNARIIDSATFLVSIFPKKMSGKNFYIQNIKNYEPVVLKHGKSGPFKEKILPDGALGAVHITDQIQSPSLSNEYPPEVNFEYPLKLILYHKVQYSAGPYKAETVEINGYGVVSQVNFMANRLPQTITITTNVTRTKETYKLIITPVEKDAK